VLIAAENNFAATAFEDEGPASGAAALPTSRPPAYLNSYGADVVERERLFRDDVVLQCVPDISWSEAQLDFDELNVMRNVDSVSSVLMLEAFLNVPREELRSILCTLIARGVLVICRATRSGFF